MFTVAEQLTSDPGSLSAYFEGSHELLHTIGGVLDIRSVFPRVSEIARRMLPHDALTMSCQDEDLNVHLEAASSDDFRGLMSDLAGVPMAPELLIGDLRKETFPISEHSYCRDHHPRCLSTNRHGRLQSDSAWSWRSTYSDRRGCFGRRRTCCRRSGGALLRWWQRPTLTPLFRP
jgi:hypothetical protein